MQADEVDPERAKLFQGVHQVPQTPSEPVVAVHQYDIHAPTAAIGQQTVELRPALFGARDTGVYILVRNLPASAQTVLP
jgi:hypothetical protein